MMCNGYWPSQQYGNQRQNNSWERLLIKWAAMIYTFQSSTNPCNDQYYWLIFKSLTQKKGKAVAVKNANSCTIREENGETLLNQYAWLGLALRNRKSTRKKNWAKILLSYGHFLQYVFVTSSSLTILTSSICTFISGRAGTSLKPRADTDRFGARGGLRLL